MGSREFVPMDFPGAFLDRGDDHYVLRMEHPILFLSSAPLGEGLVEARWVLSQQVNAHAGFDNLEANLRERAGRLGVPEGETFIGLLTAVDHRDLSVSTLEEGEVRVTALATVGITSSSSPAEKNVHNYGDLRDDMEGEQALSPATINIVVLADANLPAGALVRASTMATEAKTLALVEAGVKTREGNLVTGTVTDVTVVGHTGRGRHFRYAGSATLVGWLVANSVYRAVTDGLDAYARRKSASEKRLA